MEREDAVLLLPGPTLVPDEVREACARQVVFHRGPDFAPVVDEVLAALRRLFATGGQVVVLPCTGTGALEALLVNTLSPGDRVLACVMGTFGQRWAATAEAYGLRVERLEVPWGDAPTPEQVAARARGGGYRAVLLTHCETSTGVLLPVRDVAAAVREAAPETLVLVDAVSSFAGAPLALDAWGVDAAATGSQKALMTPPGLGIVALGPRALAAVESAGLPRFTWDLRPYLREGLPYTAAVTLWFGLRAALRRIAREGEEAVFRRHRLLAAMVRAGAEALGLQPLARPELASPTVTTLLLPAGLDPRAVVAGMHRHGVAVAGALGPLAARAFRVGHMGAVEPAHVLRGLEVLERVLGELGHPARGAVAAAARVQANPPA